MKSIMGGNELHEKHSEDCMALWEVMNCMKSIMGGNELHEKHE